MYMKYVIESHPLFKYVAWFTIICFALFVYNLTTKLKSTSSALADSAQATQNAVLEP